ncbi:MAG: hypothetical protein Q7T17_14285 [Microbacterium sp.]|uniref:PilN domain-containing protein n=1 Tax=Microbacterium sp. TaxID=51671 RepID=UPI0027289FE7|nr:hypothetical protein [Microbacterium sp.]MDO8384133.1 hypothetical protein [Microbacterium sp.]
MMAHTEPLQRSLPASPPAPSIIVPRVNLLPRAESQRRERDVLVRRWAIGLLAVIAVVAIASAGAFWLKWSAEQRLAADQLRSSELLTELASLSDVSRALSLRTDLEAFRADAMVSDVSWTTLFSDLSAALPTGVAVTGFDLTAGASPTAEDPEAELALGGTLELRSSTPIDIAPTVRSLRELPGVALMDPLEVTSELIGGGDQRIYIYRLRAAFDQTLYTGAFAEEALG